VLRRNRVAELLSQTGSSVHLRTRFATAAGWNRLWKRCASWRPVCM